MYNLSRSVINTLTNHTIELTEKVIPLLQFSCYGVDIELNKALSNLYVPNIRSNGSVEIPHSYKKNPEAIPYLMVGNKTLRLSGVMLDHTPEQRNNVKSFLVEQGYDQYTDTEKLLSYVSNRLISDGVIPIQRVESDRIVTKEQVLKIPDPRSRIETTSTDRPSSLWFYSRPVIYENVPEQISRKMHPNLYAATILIHELVHVTQALQNPVFIGTTEAFKDMEIGKELKAYRVHYDIQKVLINAGLIKEAGKNETIIEESRAEENKNCTDPYRLTPKLHKILSDAGYYN